MYSVEDIYKYSGQFDRNVTVIFNHDTESYKLYGNHITGSFIYTPKERREIQSRIDNDSLISTNGYVKFEENLKKISDEKREVLRSIGVSSSDIHEIYHLIEKVENAYTTTETRELPKAIELNIDLSDIDSKDLLLGLNHNRLTHGYKLCDFERDQHNAITLLKTREKLSKAEFEKLYINPKTGKIHDGINYYYLKEKFIDDNLNEKEQEEWEILLQKKAEQRANILAKELKKSTKNIKTINLSYGKNLRLITAITARFEPERLTENKTPVWWDYERLLHIFIRHVSELKIGENYESKSVFQYELKNIKSLIELVLESILTDIQEYFDTHPTKSFKRHGEMSIYYRGDYYVIDIEPSGRLMTFYKRE